MNSLLKTMISLSGDKNVIVVRKPFVEFTGSIDAAIMLSQLLYWTDRSRNGWVAKSEKEFSEELCLSGYGIRKANKVLRDMDIVEIVIRQFNGAPTNHYRLKLDELEDSWTRWIQRNDSLKSTKRLVEINESITETTTETTTEILCDANFFANANHANANTPAVEEPEVFSFDGNANQETGTEGYAPAAASDDELSPEEWIEKASKEQRAAINARRSTIPDSPGSIEQYRARIAVALETSRPRWEGAPDLSAWPEDVRELIYGICKFWGIRPPKSNGGGHVPVDAYWVKYARELIDACGEFGYERILWMIKENWEKQRIMNKGERPYTISDPHSLVKSARAIAGELRNSNDA